MRSRPNQYVLAADGIVVTWDHLLWHPWSVSERSRLWMTCSDPLLTALISDDHLSGFKAGYLDEESFRIIRGPADLRKRSGRADWHVQVVELMTRTSKKAINQHQLCWTMCCLAATANTAWVKSQFLLDWQDWHWLKSGLICFSARLLESAVCKIGQGFLEPRGQHITSKCL